MTELGLVHKLVSSRSELASVDMVYGLDSRFNGELGSALEFRLETAGEERDMERWDAVSASSS